MKRIWMAGAMVMLTVGAWAQGEVGRVISSTAMVQTVGVPRQVCSSEQVMVAPPKTGAGAVMGAIAGGAVANAAVTGPGQAAATMLGLMGGAIMGDRIEGAPQAQAQTVQRCSTQTFYENRTTGYQVVYEYAGRQYSVQLPQDPGPTIRLQVSPVGQTLSPPPVQMQAPAAAVPSDVVVIAQASPRMRVVPVMPPVVVWPAPVYRPSHRSHDHRHEGDRDEDWNRRDWR